jgi:hypothetical protein
VTAERQPVPKPQAKSADWLTAGSTGGFAGANAEAESAGLTA